MMVVIRPYCAEHSGLPGRASVASLGRYCLQTGPGDAAAGSEAGGEEHETPSTIDILRLFVDASYQKGIVTRSQVCISNMLFMILKI